MSKRLRIGITGASGYIGRVLVSFARAEGHEVVAMGRRPASAAVEFRRCDLSELPEDGLLAGLDGVIHLAADTSGDRGLAAREIEFATRLAKQASEIGASLVFVSSQTASEQAPSTYGRTKAAIESAVLPLGATVVRPGMVYGGPMSGLWGMLASAARVLPFVPDLRPRPLVQPVHVEDLAKTLVQALCGRYGSRVFNVAGGALTFDRFVLAIANHRFDRVQPRLPVSVPLLRCGLVFAERLAGPKLSAHRLDSLTNLPLLAAEGDLRELGIELRPLADGMTRSGRSTRRLLVEGRSLMFAVLGAAPNPWATRMYARAVATLCDGRALPLSRFLLHWPLMLAALDTRVSRNNAGESGLPRRFAMAARIAEAQVDKGVFLAAPRRFGTVFAAFDFARAAAIELLCRVVAPWARWLSVR